MGTHLKSLENFPDSAKFTRLELAENQLTGDELKHLKKYASSLETLKLGNKKITLKSSTTTTEKVRRASPRTSMTMAPASTMKAKASLSTTSTAMKASKVERTTWTISRTKMMR